MEAGSVAEQKIFLSALALAPDNFLRYLENYLYD
jgi:hypothetical protein